MQWAEKHLRKLTCTFTFTAFSRRSYREQPMKMHSDFDFRISRGSSFIFAFAGEHQCFESDATATRGQWKERGVVLGWCERAWEGWRQAEGLHSGSAAEVERCSEAEMSGVTVIFKYWDWDSPKLAGWRKITSSDLFPIIRISVISGIAVPPDDRPTKETDVSFLEILASNCILDYNQETECIGHEWV